MQKYWQVFKMGWQSMLEYRTNVVLGHVRNLIAIGVVYVLWDAAYRNQQLFSTFDRQEMLTYVFGSYILISIVFMFVSESIAHDITRGDLSK
ncbi:hypothetical protein KC571_00500, partial [candidate division WWE3 bacterium]|nr:hypothetical protein [candidate division WWE3 bacterium]